MNKMHEPHTLLEKNQFRLVVSVTNYYKNLKEEYSILKYEFYQGETGLLCIDKD